MTIEDIALQMTPGIGPKGAVHLLEQFGDARSVFATTAGELTGKAELRPELVQQIVRRKGFSAAEKELAYCRRNGIAAIASTDPEYPPLLREIPDYPHVIYVRGSVEALSARCVSVVGTREATPYGQTACNRIVEGLAERVPGLCIVSGLAFGIDVAAHRAALAAGVPTVAVLANPLPGVTPAQHTDVARDILAHGGALVTELHSQSKQNGNFYLARNRIIAGLSAGCIVVESPDSGGSLFTAHCADAYDRTVMAVPGRITDRASSGTNHLIRNRKAQLVLTADDVVRELMWDLGENPSRLRPKPATPELTPDEAGLLGCFRTDDPLSVEALGELRAEPRRTGDAARGTGAGRRRAAAARKPIHEAMKLIDTHSHLYDEAFDPDREEALARAAAEGVETLLLPAIDSESHERLFALCRRHPERCVPMMGLHPTSVNDTPRWREELASVEQYLQTPPEGIPAFCAVGEIGLDFYWSRDFREEQTEAFRRQIELALQYGLPIAVHTRDAWPETVALVREFRGRGLRGVFHAYSDGIETCRELRELGDFVFGIGGVVTFKKSRLAEVVRDMELREIVLETDCPYLTPAPHRGERNESAYVRYVCEKVAEIKGLTPAEVAAATAENAKRIFKGI